MTQHPTLHAVRVVCSSCGQEHELRSSSETIAADVCSSCHPAYTGVERTGATGSRIERFERRRALAAATA